MMSRIAAKKLTKSDLSLFKEIFESEQSNKSKQKSINLNANPFTTEFYPNLDENFGRSGYEMKVNLQIVGPDYDYPVHTLARKIVKSAKAKNWRLNGELIPTFENTDRYSLLQEGDIALIEFSGIYEPKKLKMLLISKNYDFVSYAHFLEVFDGLSSRNTMVSVSPSKIEQWSDSELFNGVKTFMSNANEISEILLSGEIENSAETYKYSNRFLSQEDLNSGKLAAEKTGLDGESIVNDYLNEKYGSDIVDWSAIENPISPYDFEIKLSSKIYLDVKSTKGKFSQPFYMSLNELKAAASVDNYQIYRISNITQGKATLSISENIKDIAITILKSVESLIDGIKPTALSISPSLLTWGEDIDLTSSEEE